MKPPNQKYLIVLDAANYLFYNYDYISKIDAITLLKSLFNADTRMCVKAWKLAYN